MLHPNSLFHQYKEKIACLETFEQNDILQPDFLLHSDPVMQIFYAPHNEYINEKSKVLIVGITPGWSQTQRAYRIAKEGIAFGLTDEEICLRCKMESRFAGAMRKNLITMLDELELHRHLGIVSCKDLFEAENNLLHTTSLIKYPCFHKGKNYSGHTPSIRSVDILRSYVENEFSREIECLQDIRLIIPLGTAVEKILTENSLPALSDVPVLRGFPHPSGLNAHRGDQFREHFEQMKDILHHCRF